MFGLYHGSNGLPLLLKLISISLAGLIWILCWSQTHPKQIAFANFFKASVQLVHMSRNIRQDEFQMLWVLPKIGNFSDAHLHHSCVIPLQMLIVGNGTLYLQFFLEFFIFFALILVINVVGPTITKHRINLFQKRRSYIWSFVAKYFYIHF